MADDEELSELQLWARKQLFLTARETGIWLLNRGQPYTGFPFLENAFAVAPKDMRTLRGKARSKLEMMEYEGAMTYTKLISAIKPACPVAKYVEATALYELGEFEDALVAYHSGIQRKRSPGEFGTGRKEAEGTIEDCIGRNAGPILEKLLPTVRWMEKHKRRPGAGLEQAGELKRRMLSRLHLGTLHEDKMLLEELHGSSVIRYSDYSRLRSLSLNAQHILMRTEEFMKTVKPYYAISRWHEDPSKTVAKVVAVKAKVEARKRAEALVERVISSENTQEIKVFLRASDVAIAFMKSQTPQRLPERDSLLTVVYDVAARVYVRQKTFSYDYFNPGDENRVVRLFLGLPVAGRLVLDSAFKKLNKPLMNYRQVTRSATEMMRTSTSPSERCYLMYTLAMCDSLRGRYGSAILMAKHCAEEAHRAGLELWQLNALLLLFRSLVRHGRRVEAVYMLDEAEAVARQKRHGAVLDFIAECRRVLKEPEDERSPQDIALAREEGLIRMMSKVGLVQEAQSAVKRLRSLPFDDRLSLPEGFDPASKLV